MPTDAHERWDLFTPGRTEWLIEHAPPPAMGYLIWTKPDHTKDKVRENIEALRERGIRHLRTGISWAEWRNDELRPWIEWYIREYAKHFTVLPCLAFTPPGLAVAPSVNAPPRNIADHAQFIHEVCTVFPKSVFDTIEEQNEWNLNTDWDPSFDPDYSILRSMIALGAKTAQKHGRKVVLGGPSKVNRETLSTLRMFARNSLRLNVNALGFHNLRGTWSDQKPSAPLSAQVQFMRNAWRMPFIPIWLTEYGFPVKTSEIRKGAVTVAELELMQVALFAYAVHELLAGTIARAYWYTYRDEIHKSLRFMTTGWEDELQFYFGDTTEHGTPRLLATLLREGGPLAVLRHAVKEGLMPLVDRASLGRIFPAA